MTCRWYLAANSRVRPRNYSCLSVIPWAADFHSIDRMRTISHRVRNCTRPLRRQMSHPLYRRLVTVSGTRIRTYRSAQNGVALNKRF